MPLHAGFLAKIPSFDASCVLCKTLYHAMFALGYDTLDHYLKNFIGEDYQKVGLHAHNVFKMGFVTPSLGSESVLISDDCLHACSLFAGRRRLTW
jgi:hypothetical protein